MYYMMCIPTFMKLIYACLTRNQQNYIHNIIYLLLIYNLYMTRMFMYVKEIKQNEKE